MSTETEAERQMGGIAMVLHGSVTLSYLLPRWGIWSNFKNQMASLSIFYLQIYKHFNF